MPTPQTRDLPDDLHEALRRRGLVQRLRGDLAKAGERSGHPSPESVIREDRDR